MITPRTRDMQFFRSLVNLTVVISTSICLLTLFVDSARACRCATSNPTAQQILDGAAAVFKGLAQTTIPTGDRYALTKFSVVESFEGPPAGTNVIVRHPSGPKPACGVNFKSGEIHMVVSHAVDESPGLATSFCSIWMFNRSDKKHENLIQEIRDIVTP